MTTMAADAEKLRELDEATRQAWSTYQDRVQSLTGEAYERAELESWTVLQNELRALERRRRLLTVQLP